MKTKLQAVIAILFCEKFILLTGRKKEEIISVKRIAHGFTKKQTGHFLKDQASKILYGQNIKKYQL